MKRSAAYPHFVAQLGKAKADRLVAACRLAGLSQAEILARMAQDPLFVVRIANRIDQAESLEENQNCGVR